MVIRNSIPKREADKVAEALFTGNAPSLTMEEVFALAAEPNKVELTAE